VEQNHRDLHVNYSICKARKKLLHIIDSCITLTKRLTATTTALVFFTFLFDSFFKFLVHVERIFGYFFCCRTCQKMVFCMKTGRLQIVKQVTAAG